jgi:N-acetylneuraminic acid mutarotase
MSTLRTEVAAAILGENIYIIGGFDKSGRLTNIVDVYKFNNNSWSKAAAAHYHSHYIIVLYYCCFFIN